MSNSDIEHASDCIFYDTEIKELRKKFKESYEILKAIEKRCDRRQTVQISKSLFDYVERSKTFRAVPQSFFCFISRDVKICIYRYRQYYSVLVVGFDYNDLDKCFNDYIGVGKLYGNFKSVDECVPLYYKIVAYYLHNVVKFDMLDLDDIPF